MKYPITLSLALPILLIVYGLVGGDGKAVLVTMGVLTLMFLLEIRLKFGELSIENIRKFFNTPIKPRTLIGTEAAVDNSPKVSMGIGILVILGGSVGAVFLVVLYFAFLSK